MVPRGSARRAFDELRRRGSYIRVQGDVKPARGVRRMRVWVLQIWGQRHGLPWDDGDCRGGANVTLTMFADEMLR